jgi:hypothetical protein
MSESQLALALCRLCRKFKPVSEFHNHKGPNRRIYRRSECKSCFFARNKKNRGKARAEFRKAKALLACSRCGWDADPQLLHFDHIDPATKSADVSSLAGQGCSRLTVREIVKCRPLCPNCHAIVTKAQREAGAFDKPRAAASAPEPVPQGELFVE